MPNQKNEEEKELIISTKNLLNNETDKTHSVNGINFLETLNNTESPNLFFTNFYDFFNISSSLDSQRTWNWSWDTQHRRDFSITNILKDESHPLGCATLKSVNGSLSNKF